MHHLAGVEGTTRGSNITITTHNSLENRAFDDFLYPVLRQCPKENCENQLEIYGKPTKVNGLWPQRYCNR